MPLIAVYHLAATMSRCPREAIWHSKDNNSSSRLHSSLEDRLILRLLNRLRALVLEEAAGILTHLRARSPLEAVRHQGRKRMLR